MKAFTFTYISNRVVFMKLPQHRHIAPGMGPRETAKHNTAPSPRNYTNWWKLDSGFVFVRSQTQPRQSRAVSPTAAHMTGIWHLEEQHSFYRLCLMGHRITDMFSSRSIHVLFSESFACQCAVVFSLCPVFCEQWSNGWMWWLDTRKVHGLLQAV